MRCIFCKLDSSNSKSVEHIIPESLGNKKNILPKGIVCDSCNNYFARKIEKPVLEMPYFKSLRGRKLIENKKGKIPSIFGLTGNRETIEITFVPDDRYDKAEIVVSEKRIFDSIKSHNKIYVPIIPKPPRDNAHISKFIGKIALEALARRVFTAKGWQDDFVDNESLDDIRNFVRRGNGHAHWPYSVRRIYGENKICYDSEVDKWMETLNEYDFLIPDVPVIDGQDYKIDNLYFVIAILGIEYCINLSNAGLSRYNKWLADNNYKSILMMEKSEFHSNLNL